MPELKLSPAGRRYGALPATSDLRDLPISRMLSINLPLSPKTNNVVYRGPIKDQGQEGSCPAHGSTAQREFLARKFENKPVVLSPAFLYYQIRLLEGTLGQGDCGGEVRTSVKAINQFGCCLLGQEPYVAGDFNTPPNTAQLQEALACKGGAYHSIGVFADMKTCMASGYGFVLGFAVYDSFENDIGPNGLMPVPDTQAEQCQGCHEVFALDYDDSVLCPKAKSRGALLVQNSWGVGWAEDGMFWMPYEVAANPQMVDSSWIQHLGKPW